MPVYHSKFRTYKTNSQDMWDMIALTCYGDERGMHFVQDANYDYRFVDGFPADIELALPKTITVGIDLKHPVQIPNIKQLLPWR
jgi:hypothetical protein